jgi:hypothetical protein
MSLTVEVSEAIKEVKDVFGEDNVEVTSDGSGGAVVIVQKIDVGEKFTPRFIWCGFHISHVYPAADVYPHFVNEGLKRVNNDPLGSGFSGPVDWQNRKAIQVSRRSNRWNPANDTAYLKLEKVIKFIQDA